jgi:O-antigen biosynthesis protein
MGLSVCFVVGSLGRSGGVRTVVRHATELARDHGMQVCLAVEEEGAAAPGEVSVVSLDQARRGHFDVAIATWWRTAYALLDIPARRHACFVQQLEDRVYRPGDVERLGAAITHDLPVHYLTEARWIADLLEELRPGLACAHVPNGIDKTLFAPAAAPPGDGPLRVLVEGSPHLWFKGVDEAVQVLRRAHVPLATTLVSPEPAPAEVAAAFDQVVGPLEHEEMADLYARTDVLLKLSRVEGVFTPPLEAFHVGATCVVWPVTGHDEYVEHERNGVVCDFDDIAGTAGWLELLSADRALLARLREGALETAARWPSWPEASALLAETLDWIARSSEPPAPGTAQLLADVDAGMAEQRIAQRRLMRGRQAAERRVERIESTLTFRTRERARRLLASLRR